MATGRQACQDPRGQSGSGAFLGLLVTQAWVNLDLTGCLGLLVQKETRDFQVNQERQGRLVSQDFRASLGQLDWESQVWMVCLEDQVHLGQRVSWDQGALQGFLEHLAMASLVWGGRKETRAMRGYQACPGTRGSQGWRASQVT